MSSPALLQFRYEHQTLFAIRSSMEESHAFDLMPIFLLSVSVTDLFLSAALPSSLEKASKKKRNSRWHFVTVHGFFSLREVAGSIHLH